MTDAVITHADNKEPTSFTQKEIGWLPWLEPLPESDFTERHRTALVDPARIKSPYFRLLARDPDILEARTKTDKDIFYNVADGLPQLGQSADAVARRAGGPGLDQVGDSLRQVAVPERIAAHEKRIATTGRTVTMRFPVDGDQPVSDGSSRLKIA
jgi:hypothetical protein